MLEHLTKGISGGDRKPLVGAARGRGCICGLWESLPRENSQRQFVNERVWLCSSKTLLSKTGRGLDLALRP